MKNKNLVNVIMQEHNNMAVPVKEHLISYFVQQKINDHQMRVTDNTFRTDLSRLKHIDRHLGHLSVKDARRSGIEPYFHDLMKYCGNKTVGEYLRLLKDIFRRAVDEGVIERSPVENIKAPRKIKTMPDPFTRQEIWQIHTMREGCHITRAMILLAIFTGLRVSELLAMSWENIDFTRKIMTVSLSMDRNGYKSPKTESSWREVELNEHAIQVLKAHFAITGNAKPQQLRIQVEGTNKVRREQHRLVFLHPKTGKGFINYKQYERSFYKPFMAICNVRYRSPKVTRQTYASQSLMAGLDKIYVARQLGHTSTDMLDRFYAKWIPEDARNYVADFDKHIGMTMPASPRKPRTPWYRTKRPIPTLLIRMSCSAKESRL